MTAERSAGKPIGEVFPQYSIGTFGSSLPDLVKVEEVKDWSAYDMVFCCLPHATTQEIIQSLPLDDVKVVDLSADFRLKNVDTYGKWYGEHKAPELQKEAVYGLVEHKRDEVTKQETNKQKTRSPPSYTLQKFIPASTDLNERLMFEESVLTSGRGNCTGTITFKKRSGR